MTPSHPLPKPSLELAKQIGHFIEYWGFKEIHGKIWTLIFLAKEPIDAKVLIENLKVSKALVSLSIKDLLHYKVIFEVEKKSPGTQKYAHNPDIFKVITNVLKSRELKLIKTIKKAHGPLQKEVHRESDLICPKRVESLGQMIETAEVLLSAFLDEKNIDTSELRSTLLTPRP